MDSCGERTSDASTYLSRALHGDLEAQFALAQSLEDEQQRDLALGWYKKAAVRGHVGASLRIGILYLIGEKAERSDAVFWLQKAATGGSSEAEFQLALAYEQGLGVDMNPDESLRWLRLAADHGNPKATAKMNSFASFLDQAIPDQGRRRQNSA